MATIRFNYLGLPEKQVPDTKNFFSSGIPEAGKIRNLMITSQRIFISNSKNVYLSILGEEAYKIQVYSSSKKYLVSTLIFLPYESRLDIYDGEANGSPIYVWIKKSCEIKNVPEILTVVGAEKMFLPLVSIL